MGDCVFVEVLQEAVMDLVVTGCGAFRALVDGELNFISGEWKIVVRGGRA